jgi:hypothetical protein
MPDPATARDAVACIPWSSYPRRGTKFVARSISTVLLLSHFELVATSPRAIVFAASGHVDGEVYGQQTTRPIKNAIGAPNAIVALQVDLQANPTSGFITRNVHASNQIVCGGVHSQ